MQELLIFNIENKKDVKSMRGFTLIEVLVAVALVSIGFFGAYGLHIQSISANNSVQFYLKAPMLAQMKISELDSSTSDIEEASGDFDEKYQGYSWKITPEDLESEEFGEAVKHLNKYTVEISDGSSSYVLTVYRYLEKTGN